MEFTVKELYAIEEIHSETNLLRLITGFVTSISTTNSWLLLSCHCWLSCQANHLTIIGPVVFCCWSDVWKSRPKDMRDPECSADSYRQSLKTIFLQY